jgi:DNA-binding beta-propeller fold protein YncE
MVSRVLPVLLPLLLGGCAVSEPREMVYDAEGAAGAQRPVWPGPPEVPRFVYAGELIGDPNFRRLQGEKTREGLFKAVAWLVGLGLERAEPKVLQRPQGGAADAQGRVFVTDVSRQAVFVFDAPAGQLRIWEMAGPKLRFRSPIGVALGAGGEVLVTDSELGEVFRLDAEGRPLGGFGAGVLNRPTGIARDPVRGLVYVADTRANDIKVFDDQGQLLDTIGSRGDTPGELNSPTYIALAQGRLYVTDTLNSRVQVFDTEGNASAVVGQRGLYVGNLARPKGVAVDDEGNLYVVESYYDHLLIFDGEGRLLLPIGGTGKQPGQFYLPAGVWTDTHDRVYVADMFNGRVSVFQFLGGG